MPRGDGTGSLAIGPMGRGRGGCQGMGFGVGFGRGQRGGFGFAGNSAMNILTKFSSLHSEEPT